jgi:hypothetical protein
MLSCPVWFFFRLLRLLNVVFGRVGAAVLTVADDLG